MESVAEGEGAPAVSYEYEPARGAERKWIVEVRRRLLKRIRDSKAGDPLYVLGLLELDHSDLIISAGHALEGVRTNGHQQLTAGATVLRDLHKFSNNVNWHRLQLIAADGVVAELRRELAMEFDEQFEVCKACEGEGGRKITRAEAYGGKSAWDKQALTWVDCDECHGRGMLKKEGVKK